MYSDISPLLLHPSILTLNLCISKYLISKPTQQFQTHRKEIEVKTFCPALSFGISFVPDYLTAEESSNYRRWGKGSGLDLGTSCNLSVTVIMKCW